MRERVRWGVLGVAAIAVKKVVPAMQRSALCDVAAIASRDGARSRAAAAKLGIPKWYGSYQELLADPEIDAIYNPLPNHLHVPWSIAAAEAGKHVLCEKPIGLSVAEALELVAARDRAGVKMGEAFMARTHPQWQWTREQIRAGAIGELRSIVGCFSYFNADPHNIRNIAAYGGGGLMDIGCYPIHMSRFVSGEEPLRVAAAMQNDPSTGTDRLASAILEFPYGHSIFTCGTQLAPYQRMQFFGAAGALEIEIPFNAPPDRPTRVLLNGAWREFPVCDQYQIQGDLFSRAILDGGEAPVPLEDSVKNMAAIEAAARSARSGRWETPERS